MNFFDRCMEKSAVQTETWFSFHEGRKYFLGLTHTHILLYELLGLYILFPNFWAGCLSYVGLLLAVSLIHFSQCAIEVEKICSTQEYKVANLAQKEKENILVEISPILISKFPLMTNLFF